MDATDADADASTLTVETEIDLDVNGDAAWAAVATPDGWAAWLAPVVALPAVEPGAAGRVVDDEGVERRLVVRQVEAGRSVTFTWWREDAPADASTVTLTLTPVEAGRSRLRVTETLAGVRARASVASASRWVVAVAQLALVAALVRGHR